MIGASEEVGDVLTAGLVGCTASVRHDIQEEVDETALGTADARLFRGDAAWLNYMGPDWPDRPDMQYAIKEAARCMASPRECDWARPKKIGKYLLYRPRVVMKHLWQQRPRCIDVYTDSN